jgi:hypothetical protein
MSVTHNHQRLTQACSTVAESKVKKTAISSSRYLMRSDDVAPRIRHANSASIVHTVVPNRQPGNGFKRGMVVISHPANPNQCSRQLHPFSYNKKTKLLAALVAAIVGQWCKNRGGGSGKAVGRLTVGRLHEVERVNSNQTGAVTGRSPSSNHQWLLMTSTTFGYGIRCVSRCDLTYIHSLGSFCSAVELHPHTIIPTITMSMWTGSLGAVMGIPVPLSPLQFTNRFITNETC